MTRNYQKELDELHKNANILLRGYTSPNLWRHLNDNYWTELFNILPHNSFEVVFHEDIRLRVNSKFKYEIFEDEICDESNFTSYFHDRRMIESIKYYPRIPIIYYYFSHGFKLHNPFNSDLSVKLYVLERRAVYDKDTNIDDIPEEYRYIFSHTKKSIENYLCKTNRWFNIKFKLRRFYKVAKSKLF